MKKLLALCLLVPAYAQDPKPDPKTYDVVVALEDGSRFKATMSEERLVVRSEYGEQRIPFRDVRSVRAAKNGEHTVHTAKLTVTGKLGVDQFPMETPVGRVSVPVAKIRALDVGRAFSIFADDATAGLWSFEDGQLRDRVRERSMTATDMEVQTDSDGRSALVRKNENGHAVTPNDEELKFATGDFTIETRVFVGSTTRSYVTILSKNDTANAQLRNYCLLVQNNGAMYWDSLSNGGAYYHTMTNQPVVALNEWAYLAVVVEVKAQRITFYVNGKQVHQVSVAFQIAVNDGPLYFGASPAAHSWTGAPEKIQFVRLSKAARSPEEIREMQEALASGAVISVGGTAARGIQLREGGYFAADFPSLAGATFRTKLGSLRISEKAVGQISVYKFREKELEKVQARVQELIEGMESDLIDEREEAQNEILRIGAPAIPLLQAAQADADEEVKARIDGILKKFEETGAAKQPIADVFRMGKTVLYGWLERDRLEVSTAFGKHEVELREVATIQLGAVKEDSPKLLRLRSGEVVQGEAAQGAVVELDVEYGKLTIPFKDVTSLTYDETAKLWRIKTERFTGTAKLTDARIELETPAGTITVPLTEVTEFGLPPKEEPKPNPQPQEQWEEGDNIRIRKK